MKNFQKGKMHVEHVSFTCVMLATIMVNKTGFDILIIETNALLGKRWEVAGCCTFYLFLKTNLNNWILFFLQKEDNSWKYMSQLLLTSYFILVCLNEKFWLLLILFLHDGHTKHYLWLITIQVIIKLVSSPT